MTPMQTGGELTRYLLGSGAVTLVIVAIVQGVVKLYENRTTLKHAKITANKDEELAAEQWNAAYRAAVERHLPYDLQLRQDIMQLRSEVNDLRRAMHWEPRDFLALPPPPPLFPNRQDLNQ